VCVCVCVCVCVSKLSENTKDNMLKDVNNRNIPCIKLLL